MTKTPKTGLTKKHWFGYMFGDWGGCMTFARNQNKNGKFRPWLLRATPLLAITAIALWTVPTFLDGIPLLVALFILGSWAAFKFVWNITPEIRAKMVQKKAAVKANEEA